MSHDLVIRNANVVDGTGAAPFAVEWTLGTSDNPTAFISDGKASEVLFPIEPFADLRSASSGYGGGECRQAANI